MQRTPSPFIQNAKEQMSRCLPNIRLLLTTVLLTVSAFSIAAQTVEEPTDTIVRAVADSVKPIDTDTLRMDTVAVAMPNMGGLKVVTNPTIPPKAFVPDPQRALWLALVLPGGGQIYNRKYWKLPIFYGGFLGCTYAFLWNQQMYMDYSQAYLDIMDDDPNTKSYMDMLPPNYDITGREERFKTIFKNRKNRYRRWRDLSGFCFIGVYLLSVIDAYVDAQLSVFDISPDLSMHVGPAVINQKCTNGRHDTQSYGVGCTLNF